MLSFSRKRTNRPTFPWFRQNNSIITCCMGAAKKHQASCFFLPCGRSSIVLLSDIFANGGGGFVINSGLGGALYLWEKLWRKLWLIGCFCENSWIEGDIPARLLDENKILKSKDRVGIENKARKLEGCLKITYEEGLFQKSFAGATTPLVTNTGTESRSPQLKVLPSLWFISRPTGAPSCNDVSSQGLWIPSHGGLRRLNTEQVFGIQAICERLVKPHMGLSINKRTQSKDLSLMCVCTLGRRAGLKLGNNINSGNNNNNNSNNNNHKNDTFPALILRLRRTLKNSKCRGILKNFFDFDTRNSCSTWSTQTRIIIDKFALLQQQTYLNTGT